MNILITSSRMPFAVEEIRKLGEEGHTVFAADTYDLAPGNHSKYAQDSFKIPAPRQDPREFIKAVSTTCEQNEVDLLVPAFEEGIYLSRYRGRLPKRTTLFAAAWHQLLRLHKKSSFLALAKSRHLPVPPTSVVTNRKEMERRMKHYGDYFARPVYSRGATQLLTNRAIQRGKVELEDCDISANQPWVIQPFVEGGELCTYSIAREGRLVAHVTYRHPLTLGDRGGIAFEVVDSEETLPIARTLAKATNFTGQFGLDFIDSSEGLFLAECNTRATAGVGLIPSKVFAQSLAPDPPADLFVAESGERRQITTGLFFDSLQNPSHLADNIKAFFEYGDDVYSANGDLMPGLYSLLSFVHARKYQKDMPEKAKFGFSDVVASQFYDICWQQS